MRSNGHSQKRTVVPSERFRKRCEEVLPHVPALDRILNGVKLELALREDRDIEGSRHVSAAIWTHQTNDEDGEIPALWIVYSAANPKQAVLHWVDVAGQDIPTQLRDGADNGR